GVAPIDYGPVLLLMPFRSHLATDTLPSRELRKTYPTLSGQRGITPAFGYGTPHPGARGTLTLLNNVLLSTHYGPVRLPGEAASGLCIPLARWSLKKPSPLRGVSQVPRLIFPHAPSPTTPQSPMIALAPLLHHRVQASSRMAAWPLSVCITRPNRVRFRYGSRVRLRQASLGGSLRSALARLPVEWAITRQAPFSLQDQPVFPGAPYIALYGCDPATRATSLSRRPNPGLSWFLNGRRHKKQCWCHP